jgi:hypothetical protein
MRVALSECMPDYVSYTFPYHVWGFLDEGETVSTALALGFLPLAFDLSRFYLTRGIRIQLDRYCATARTRYVGRRSAHLSSRLLPRAEFELTSPWRQLARAYFASRTVAAEHRERRFFQMIDAPFTTHVMLLTDYNTGEPAALAPVYLEPGASAEYGIPVYEPKYTKVSVGNHLLAETLATLRSAGCDYAYLGTCYTNRDLYKTRFPGMQFFNGYTWSSDRAELRLFIGRQQAIEQTHVLSTETYLDAFANGDPSTFANLSLLWQVQPSGSAD